MNKPGIQMPQTYSFAGVQLRPWHRLLLRDGHALTIGSRAFEVLLALVVRSPELVSKATLLDEAWPGLTVEEANLHVQISALRRLLGPGVIGTAPGLGYRLTVPVISNSISNLGADPEESLLGRAQDLERIGSVLAGHRLVTITGPAGVGKSALARVIAAASSGAVWVDLAAIEKPEHLAAAVANAAKVSLGMR